MTSAEERLAILNLVYEMDKETPFTALGFFDVDQTTLTSLVSTVLTYLVIMVQFQQTETVTPAVSEASATIRYTDDANNISI